MDDIELPPPEVVQVGLVPPFKREYYTADQVRAAIAADRAKGGEAPWGVVELGKDGNPAIYSPKFNVRLAEFARGADLQVGATLYLRPSPAPEARPLQAGMENDALRKAWDRKLPGVEPTDAQLTAFAIGAEVGFDHAQNLEKQDWSRFHHVMHKHGLHPGRTDDDLIEVLDAALSTSPTQAQDAEQAAMLDWLHTEAHATSYTIEISREAHFVDGRRCGSDYTVLRTRVGAGPWVRRFEGATLRDAIRAAMPATLKEPS